MAEIGTLFYAATMKTELVKKLHLKELKKYMEKLRIKAL